MLEFMDIFNRAIAIFFTLCFGYQVVYVIVGVLFKPTQLKAKKNHKYAIIIPARNESSVIAELIKSIQAQRYPKDKIDIFVCADNCTDNTAEIARNAGAITIERNNKQQVGKGYALNYVFQELKSNPEYSEKDYDGYFVFDADNLIDVNFVAEMNKTFDNGYRVVTSYRNSKNYSSNWISSGYSIWYLREAKFLNNVRMINNTSCMISGTGFLIHKNIIEKNDGWKHYLLTEDIEFSVDSVLCGEKIGYNDNAILYDEQPIKFIESWNQRLRWVKGIYQVFAKYGGSLLKAFFQGKGFTYYDMFVTVSPALLVTILGVCANVIAFFIAIGTFNSALILLTLKSMLATFLSFYSMMFLCAFLTVITEWKRIHCKSWQKLIYTATFPLFILTYIPITFVALFKKIEWKPIKHTVVKSVDDFTYHK